MLYAIKQSSSQLWVVAKDYLFLGYLVIIIVLSAPIIIAPIKIRRALGSQKSN